MSSDKRSFAIVIGLLMAALGLESVLALHGRLQEAPAVESTHRTRLQPR